MTFESARAVSLEVLSASADIPQRRFVTFAATNGVRLPATLGDSTAIVGVTLEAYDDSEVDAGNGSPVVPVACMDGAILEVEAGMTLTVGMRIISGNDGRAMENSATATGTTPAGDYQEIGVVLKGGAVGEIVTIKTINGQIITTAP